MLDALVVTETNLKDSMISAQLRNIGFKLINIMRSLPDGRTNNRVGGGVALLVRKDTRMTLLSQCQAGAFTAAVTATGKPTVIVIGAYIPPLRSTSSSHTTKKLDLRTNKPSSTDKREEIFLYIQTEYLRHHLNYPTTILMDANSRCTSADGERRITSSPTPPSTPYHRKSTAQLLALFSALHIRPVHGRPDQIPGQRTARQVSDPNNLACSYEIDFVCNDPKLIQSIALPYGPWGTTFAVHRPVCVQLSTEGWEQNKASRSLEEQHAPPKPRARFPAYSDSQGWTALTSEFRKLFKDQLYPLRDDHSAAEMLDALTSITHQVLHDKRVKGTDFRARIMRKFRGFSIPAPVANQYNRVRQLFKAARKLNKSSRSRRRRGLVDPEAAARNKATALDLQRSISNKMKATTSIWRDHLTKEFRSIRSSDPSTYYKLLNLFSSAGNMDVFSPKETIPGKDGIPAREAIKNHLTKVNAARAPPPAALSTPDDPLAPASLLQPIEIPDYLAIGRDVTTAEVYRLLYGHHKSLTLDPRCNCDRCNSTREQLDAWREGKIPRPDCPGRIKTSKGAGPDGLYAEALCWQRLGTPQATFTHRMQLCEYLASALGKLLKGDPLPADFAATLLHPLLKPAKKADPRTGVRSPPQDKADPTEYRYVSLIKLTHKILKTLLAERTQHLVCARHPLNPAQAGFVARRSAERQIFTLTEAIKARLRAGESTWVLFVDFRNAYGEASPKLLQRSLQQLGLDAPARQLLHRIMSSTTAHARVNGEEVGPIPIRTGLGQGCPLSCLLFDLFVESLSRYLSSRPDIPGVEALNETFHHLFFADDLAVLAKSREELEIALKHIIDWAKDWGMELNFSLSKTEYMVFTPQSIRRSIGYITSLPPIKVRESEVKSVSSYKYLGHLLTHNLSIDVIIDKKEKGAWAGYKKVSSRNPHASGSSTAEQIQLYNTEQQGQLTYSLALITLSDTDRDALNLPILAAAYAMLGRKKHENTSKDAALVATRSMLAQHIQVRERERLFLTLVHCPYRKLPRDKWPPCIRLFDALRAEAITPKSHAGIISNWAHVTQTLRDKAIMEGAMQHLSPTVSRPIETCAHAFARSCAYISLKRSLGPTPPGADKMPVTEPRTFGSKNNFLTLAFWLPRPVSDLGDHHGYTDLAMIGPGTCNGNLLALANLSKFPRLKNWLLGAEALMLWPFRDPAVPHSLRGNLNHVTRHSKFECRTCSAPGLETTWHIALQCTNPALREHRAELWKSTKQILLQILDMEPQGYATGDQPISHHDSPRLSSSEKSELKSLLSPEDNSIHTKEARFLTYWTMSAFPWPSSIASSTTERASYLLGKHFESICAPASCVRNLANTWVSWSERAIRMLARAHHRALAPAPSSH